MLAVDATRADEVRRAVAIEFRGHMTTIRSDPGEWKRWVDSVVDPRIPWEQVLAAALRRSGGWPAGHTHPSTAAYLESRRLTACRFRRAVRGPSPSVAVIVDASGSMDDGLLAQALG